MAVIDYGNLIEYSEDLNHRYEGRSALAKRCEYRLRIESGVWPFTRYGVDYNLFSPNSIEFQRSVESMLGEFRAVAEVTPGAVYVADIRIPMS